MRYPVSNDTLEAGDLAILGRKGTGKTTAAKSCCERLIRRGHRCIIIDPVSTWWGLKLDADGASPGLPVLVIGGPEADIPIPDTEPDTAEKIAQLILATDVSVVLDIADLKRPDNLTFIAGVLHTLYQEHTKGAVWLVLEEADIFAPNNPKSTEQRACFNEIEHLARRGRSKGFRLISITQRPARLHKDVLTQFDTLITFAMPGRHDREAIKDWLSGVTDQDTEVFRTLPTLAVGEAWCWTPRTQSLTRQHFPMITTYDSSSTPAAGHPRVRKAALSDEQLTRIRELFASLFAQTPRPRLRTNSPTPSTAGAAIRDLRRLLKLSQSDLGQLIGSEQKSISRMESGVVAVSTATLERIATATKSQLRIEYIPAPRRPAS